MLPRGDVDGAGCDAGPPVVTDFSELVARAGRLTARGRRALLGICGAPGVGKSSLARAIVNQVGGAAALVGMDGFHLSRTLLADMGHLDRMGAIYTFDAWGFVALVRRIRTSPNQIVYAPEFDRGLELSIAAAVPIEPSVQLVVIEGNYLLVPEEPWGELREQFEEIWYCERDEGTRIADLIARHRAYGKSEEEATRFVVQSDQRNAKLIETTRSRADIVVKLDGELAHDVLE